MAQLIDCADSGRKGARLRATTALLCTLLGLAARLSHAEDAYSEDAVKAAFLYRFAGYVDWPPARSPAEFTIAVFEADGVVRELQKILPSHPIKGLAARVRPIRNMRELGDSQMLYIGPGHAYTLRVLVAAVGDRPVLVVTDDDDGLDLGGALNFLQVDKRVRFEVSLTAAERSGLRISSELLSVATRVQGGHLRSGVFCTPGGELESTCNFSVASLIGLGDR